MIENVMEQRSETVAEFRVRLATWLHGNLSARSGETFDLAAKIEVNRGLYDEGFLGLTWPTQYGGRGLTADYQTAYNQTAAPYDWALLSNSVTVGICAATLLDYGTEDQKLRHIPRMLRGDELWTQLLSEPGAGSDLAGATTRAVVDGDKWRIDGQKVWTSLAVESQFAVAFVRTDPDVPKYQGVSMIIIDLAAPGVDIRPLRQMTGEANFNEVFLDDVRVPRDNLLGELNDGWAVLSRMLFHERMALSAGTAGGLMARDAFDDLLALSREHRVDQEPDVRHALGETYIQHRLLSYMGSRIREATQSGQKMGPVGSIGKIGIAKLSRHIAETGVMIAGASASAWAPGDRVNEELVRQLLHFPMTGIAGGTTEIQKNVVAERVLGLPREQRTDRDVPFRQLPSGTGAA